jgi:hypothetical protein
MKTGRAGTYREWFIGLPSRQRERGEWMNDIAYSAEKLASYAHPYSQLQAVEPGDVCCNCGRDCDGEGFAQGHYHAVRVHGHPFCARGGCYYAKITEYAGSRSGCRCGLKNTRRNGET